MNRFIGDLPIPDIRTIIARALLVGDFFGTPNSLGGVEWTLRIEVLFYILMAAFKAAGFMKRPNVLPFAFGAVSAALFLLPAFPYKESLPYGYLTIYGPLLFIGSCIYLSEHKLASRAVCTVLIISIMSSTLFLFCKYQPSWKDSNFAISAVLLFVAAFLARTYLPASSGITLLSGMTYSIYLFHKWLWVYVLRAVEWAGAGAITAQIVVLVIIFIVCYAAHKTIEDYGLRLGRRAVKLLSAKAPILSASS